MDPEQLFHRYKELQRYVGWTEDDAQRVRALEPILQPYLHLLVEDFYSEIARHPEAHRVFTGGQAQIDRLKGSLLHWLEDLLRGPYDAAYVYRRWKVGARHVEIGLDQVYTNVALSRLRTGMIRAIGESWKGNIDDRILAIESLNRLLDLDLAKIEDAYQAEYTARLQGAERLATLGQIAGGVAHELRNPLNVIKSSVYYLLNARSLPSEKLSDHLKRIERNVDLANDVITSLSNFARIPVPEMQQFVVEPFLAEVLGDCPLGDAISVTMEVPAGLPAVLADRGQIRIVVSNLIRNARDAMPEGGTLTLRARQVDHDVEIEVSDTGIGIAQSDLARIMEPLYSTKARGLGLGLAISRMILQKNHGTLRVQSEPGKGSTFTARLSAAGERRQ